MISLHCLGLVIAHFVSLSVEAIERSGGKDGMEVQRTKSLTAVIVL